MHTVYKKVSLVLLLVYAIMLIPFTNAEASTPEKIKIGLYYGSGANDSYTISSQDGITISLANDQNSSAIFTDSKISSMTVKKNTYFSTEYAGLFPDSDSAFAKVEDLRAQGYDAYCSVKGGIYSVRIGLYATFEEAQASAPNLGTYAVQFTSTGVLFLSGEDVIIAVDGVDSFPEVAPISGNISINSVAYRGSLRFLRSSGNDMAAINVLPLEEYLYSVVPKEVSASWNEEVLKAQAVAARTFTITSLNKFAKYGFNLDNTTASQVYGGVDAEHPRTTAAVDATKGEIVLYNGAPASIYYHASSGGRTANSEDVWSSALPYLRSVEDPYENPKEATHGKWEISYTKEELKSALAQRGVNIGDIVDVVTEYSDGHATKLTFVGTNGSKSYTKDNIRVPLSLKSTNFTLTKSGKLPEKSILSKVFPSARAGKSLASIGKNTANHSKALANSFGSSEIFSGSAKDYTFTGGGWGHGVGMSQWGAKGMADNGFTYKEILTHYFTGVQVETY